MTAAAELPDATLEAAAVRRRTPQPLEAFPVRWDGRSAVISLPARVDGVGADQVRDVLLAIINPGHHGSDDRPERPIFRQGPTCWPSRAPSGMPPRR